MLSYFSKINLHKIMEIFRKDLGVSSICFATISIKFEYFSDENF